MQPAAHHAQVRSWWSRSASGPKSPSDKHHSQPTGAAKQPKKLATLASAIGLKPRKSTVAIQDPPSPVLPLHTGNLEPLPLSVGDGWDDAIVEPKKAATTTAYAHSVMSSSDVDPFSARFIPTSPVTLASNRISAFSDVSTSTSSQAHHHQDFTLSLNRQSYTSSSDNSHSFLPPPLLAQPRLPPHPNRSFSRPDVPIDVGSSPELLSPLASSNSDTWRVSRLTTSSDKVIRRDPPFFPVDASDAPLSGSSPQIRPSPSTSTLTDKSPRPDARAARPKSRPRGLTDVGPSTRPRPPPIAADVRFLPGPKPPLPSEPPSPIVMRQPSFSRTKPVPAARNAPPRAELPPPPSTSRLQEPSYSASSSSSSLISPATTRSPRSPRSPPAAHSSPTLQSSRQRHHELSPTRSIKKAISAQSLRRPPSGPAATANAPSSPLTLTPEEATKTVKKQRSFHHTRIPLTLPIPPLPASLRHAASSSSATTSTVTPSRDKDKDREHEDRRVSTASSVVANVGSPSPRRRLFSGSSLRRSVSSQAHSTAATGEDDARSIFSFEDTFRSKHQSSGNRPTTAAAATADTSSSSLSHSFWDDHEPERELLSPPPPSIKSPRGSGSDFAPQHIMAPADMLRLEAELLGSPFPPPPPVPSSSSSDAAAAAMSRSRGMSFTSVATTRSGTFSDVGGSTEGSFVTPLTMSPCSPRSTYSGASRERERDRGRDWDRDAVDRDMDRLQPPPRSLGLPAPRSPVRRPATTEASTSKYSPSMPLLVPPPSLSSASSSSPASPPTTPDAGGLSPPPRARPRPSTAQAASTLADRRVSMAPVTPLSPPPSWRGLGAGGRPRVSSNASAGEGVATRPAISRRPSFLEIEEHSAEMTGSPPLDSFLDMGKSSFDTVRSGFDDDR